MEIELLLDAKPVKKRPYKLDHKYKDIYKKEIDSMLIASIIYQVEQFEWVNPMVMKLKKQDPKKLQVCINFRWLNRVTITNPFPTQFGNEIINEVIGHECYSFTNEFLGYNQVPIAKGD